VSESIDDERCHHVRPSRPAHLCNVCTAELNALRPFRQAMGLPVVEPVLSPDDERYILAAAGDQKRDAAWQQIERLREALNGMRRHGHPDTCAEVYDRECGVCSCGADEHNARIDAALGAT